jgi:hypothetical protein
MDDSTKLPDPTPSPDSTESTAANWIAKAFAFLIIAGLFAATFMLIVAGLIWLYDSLFG